jgi:predicted GIY-YIG superfamily endonuclease
MGLVLGMLRSAVDVPLHQEKDPTTIPAEPVQLIYILELKGGRYYVGSSTNIAQRLFQHFSGKGSAWTKKYHPIQVVGIRSRNSLFTEDNVTKEYMLIYGIDNVRGGCYCSPILPSSTIQLLKRELWAARAQGYFCFRCGDTNHGIIDCRAQIDIDGDVIYDKEK